MDTSPAPLPGSAASPAITTSIVARCASHCPAWTDHRMNRLRSSSCERASSRSRTRASSMTTCLSARSEASKLRSSSTRSRIVCSRRAPMFWVDRLTWKARSAMVSIAASANSSVIPSVASSAWYCREQRGARLAEDAGEIVAGQVVHLDADREPALELGHQVRRLGAVERAGGDEQDVVGLDRAVLGVDGRSLDDRQQVALNALPRDVRARGSSLRRW